MLHVLRVAFLGLAFAQYELTKTKSGANEVEFQSRIRDKSAKTATEMRMRIRSTTDDHTLEMEMESRSIADKTKVQARTRFNARDVYLYVDTNLNGLLDVGEVSTSYDLSNQWGPINCSSSTPYLCTVCNAGGLPANALCFEFLVTDTTVQFGNHTVHPTTVKIGMNWDPTSVSLGISNRIAIVGRFRSQTTFKDRKAAASDDEEEQPTGDGSTVKWEKQVYSPAGAGSDVKVSTYIPSAAGASEGTEKDNTDGSSMSFRQLQFSFEATEPFKWDPDITMPTSGAIAIVPGVLALLALWA